MRQFRMIFALVALAFLFCTLRAPAQVATSSITGFVTDASGAFLPGVRVVATNIETGMSRIATATPEGSYAITSIPPGRISAVVEGFLGR